MDNHGQVRNPTSRLRSAPHLPEVVRCPSSGNRSCRVLCYLRLWDCQREGIEASRARIAGARFIGREIKHRMSPLAETGVMSFSFFPFFSLTAEDLRWG